MLRQRKPRSVLQRFILFAVAVISLFGGYYWGTQHAPTVTPYQVLSALEQPLPVQDFNLLDQQGQVFSRERLKGYWNLLLTGYTTSDQATVDLLTLATRILNRLAEWPDLQANTRVIFITLDPETDTPRKLADFFSRYSADFIALTGDESGIETFVSQLGVKFKRIELDDEGSYRIDHSTSIAVVDPEGRLAGLFTGRVDAVSIAADLQRLANSERK